MNFLYLIPFTYFAQSRLARGSWVFHALFEWVAALFLVSAFGAMGAWASVGFAVGGYFAFISLYEVGYLYNDLVSSRKEAAPRLRGPQGAGLPWFAAWVLVRLAIFVLLTALLRVGGRPDWWLFFGAMMLVFALHNGLHDKESKVATFLWLAWFRFMAPVIFVILPSQRMGIAMGAASLYAAFRLFGYLDSKGLLAMPRRQTMKFRAVFFLMPLAAATALWSYPEAQGFCYLALYFATIALAAWAAQHLKQRMDTIKVAKP